MARNRFTNNALSELQEANHSPIYGYQHLRLLSLEEATEKVISLVPGVVEYVSNAKRNCNQNSILLTRDESAAIYLYSMPVPFYSCLNDTLRAENRHALKPWFAFLKLFITALEKLPSTKKTVWRGVTGDATSVFADDDVHIWWSINSCTTALNVVEVYLGETGTVFAIETIHGKNISEFSAFPVEKEIVLMPGTRLRAKCQSLSSKHLLIVHLEEESNQSEFQTGPNYLFGYLKQEYQQHSRIERIMDPSKSFPIEQSYINLDFVEAKEQQDKEKKLLNMKYNHEIIGTYEQIYGTKIKIKIEDIFQRCRDPTKKILVLGRAGIGKTTFCQYIVYRWATGAIWQQYDLIVLIRLRTLTESRYPPLSPGTNYSPFDLLKKEYFHHGLSDRDERLLREQFDSSQVLWLLDGYDEIIQNVPSHLQYLLEQLLKTPHHILTSRPYSNTLSYNVRLEIIGFTDDNIKNYVEQFFDQIKDEIENVSLQVHKLRYFFNCNPRIWGIAHIPVNLELICSLWCDTDWSEVTILTMTSVYDKMIEWLCRRYLGKQNVSSNRMTKEDVYEHCNKELAFLESLAFHGMESKTIILPPKLLRRASKESACSPQHQPHLLNMGILRSLDYKPVGTQIEVDKNHYFIHLSFQEHFAARYLVKALNDNANQKKIIIDFIKKHKYNQRFELVLSFASGLLIDNDDEQPIKLFWDTLSEQPLDLIGIKHAQLIICCMEETSCNETLPRFRESMTLIIKWVNYYISHDLFSSNYPLTAALQRSLTLVNQTEMPEKFVKLHKDRNFSTRHNGSWFTSDLRLPRSYVAYTNLNVRAFDNEDDVLMQIACEAVRETDENAATNDVINRFVIALGDTNDRVRSNACSALGIMGEKATTNEVINGLLTALEDTNAAVRSSACKALSYMGEKATTNEVINGLLIALEDTNDRVKISSSKALGIIGESVTTKEVINGLLNALKDANDEVRSNACSALGKMGEKAATKEVIHRLLIALEDTDDFVRSRACEALSKMGEKVTTKEVINGLLIALGDANDDVRSNACQALGEIGEKAATKEVINKLLIALGDTNRSVRIIAGQILSKIREKSTLNEVINGLLIALEDANDDVRSNACETLSKMGEKVATKEVINGLLIALEDTDDFVRSTACEALGEMGEKEATYEVINKLLIALEDTDDGVRTSACEALSNMGEKVASKEVINRLLIALGNTNRSVRIRVGQILSKIREKSATNKVINGLLVALGDTNHVVRSSACQALGEMGEKAATNEVINKLLIALEDTDDFVRSRACEALSKMGEKVATKEVINRLMMALKETDVGVRFQAYTALGKMGEKAATNEVIELLLDAFNDLKFYMRHEYIFTVENMLALSLCIPNIKHESASKLSTCIDELGVNFLRNISREILIKACMNKKILYWLPVIIKVSIAQGYAITITENTLTLFGNQDPVELPFSNTELDRQQLQDLFVTSVDELKMGDFESELQWKSEWESLWESKLESESESEVF